MRDAQIIIRGTDVVEVNYKNTFKTKPGERLDIQLKNSVGIVLNPAAPTNAMVRVKFEAADPGNALSFSLQTVTSVSSSTYVDDFEEYIKENYLNTIMVGVNEKIRAITAQIGLNLTMPPIVFGKKADDNNDNIIDFTK